MKAIETLRETAKKLLKNNKVEIIIGYENIFGNQTTPCFIENENETEKLTWSHACVYNLANYLVPLISECKKKKIGIVAKGCDVKSIIGLIQEHQVKREDVVIIGMECYGQKTTAEKEFQKKCSNCNAHIPKVYDELIGDAEQEKPVWKDGVSGNGIDLKNKSFTERWDFWSSQFEKCIRCYACREVCPLCYCRECVVDCNSPQWCSPVPSLTGNATWNIIRAYHLAGRCVGCEECERVCPVNIPLMELNKAMTCEVKELFNYTSGESWEIKPPLCDFTKEDKVEFIL